MAEKVKNSGNGNTGDWNTGNYQCGFFNTKAQNKIFCFNKLCDADSVMKFPDFLFFSLTEWIPANRMTAAEKEAHPEHEVTDGYLKTYGYKEAFRKSFEAAKAKENWTEELAKLQAIPNFDAEIFYEISGIKPEELN